MADRYTAADAAARREKRAREGETDREARTALAKMKERESFTYRAADDPLFTALRSLYAEQGRQAALSAQGQAAALTGGYGNSYAASAGNAAYGQELSRLNALLPDMYDRARQRWKDEGDRLESLYRAAADRSDAAFARARALRQDGLSERAFAASREDAAWQREQDERSRAYSLAMLMLQNGLAPGADLARGSGISEEDIASLLSLYRKGAKGGKAYAPKERDGGFALSALAGALAALGANSSRQGRRGGGQPRQVALD